MEEERRRAVRHPLGVQRMDEAQVIDVLVDLWEQIARPPTALPVLAELPQRFHHTVRRAAHPRVGDDAGVVEAQSLAVVLQQARLVVIGIDVADAALHEQEDDAPGLRGEVKPPGSRHGGASGVGSQAGKGEITEAAGGALEGLTAAEKRLHEAGLQQLGEGKASLLSCYNGTTPCSTSKRPPPGTVGRVPEGEGKPSWRKKVEGPMSRLW